MSLGNIPDFNYDFEKIPDKIFLRGVSFENRQEAIQKLKEGMDIKLIRDPFNKFDRFAIKVTVACNNEDVEIGWVPKEIAQVLSPEIDAKIEWKGKIIEITNTFEKIKGVAVKLYYEVK